MCVRACACVCVCVCVCVWCVWCVQGSICTRGQPLSPLPLRPPQEPFSRIKKDLLREAKALAPGDRVLIVGNSREPWLAAKKDERAIIGFWSKALLLPLPDYASRRVRVYVSMRGGQGEAPSALAARPQL